MKRAILTIFFVLFLGVPLISQGTLPVDTPEPLAPAQRTDSSSLARDQIREMQKKQRELREKQLKDDTAKLLQLATELKESVDKTNQHVLSLEVVRKAEEIEKLAKHIKTNMRDETR